MPTLPNMGLVTPTLGADIGVWDDKINAAFALIDEHDHTLGKGAAITPAAMSIDADIGMGGNGLAALGKVAFTAVATPTTGAKNLFVDAADNELYWRSNAGVNVKLTSNASLNTSLVGGIVGDYSAAGAEVAYDATNKRFTFKQAASPGGKWARMASGPVRIYEFDTTESLYVEHAVAAALAASYTVEWPAALPGTQALVQIGADGKLTYSNTLAANANLTLSGTGYVQHGDDSDVEVFLPNSAWYVDTGSPPSFPSGPGLPDRVTVGSSCSVYYPLRIGNSKRRVKSITVFCRSFVDTTTLSLYSTTGIGSGSVSTNPLNLSGGTTATTLNVTADGLWNGRTLTLSSPSALHAAGSPVWLRVQTSGTGSLGCLTYRVNYDRP